MRGRSIFAVGLLFLFVADANAHRLRVYAAVADGAASGYAFFVGGGRAAGATLIIRDMAGDEILRTTTAGDGSFSHRIERPADLQVIVDAGDGHVATLDLPASTFGAPPVPTDERAAEDRITPSAVASGLALIAALAVGALWVRARWRALAGRPRSADA